MVTSPEVSAWRVPIVTAVYFASAAACFFNYAAEAYLEKNEKNDIKIIKKNGRIIAASTVRLAFKLHRDILSSSLFNAL